MDKIKIICSDKQKEELIAFGCIRNDDDICDCNGCDTCEYSTDNIDFDNIN